MAEQHFVAIGGSAGSLVPLKSFFDHVPLDSASYVILRHMPQNYRSELASILSRHSELRIVDADHGMKVEVNQVYVGPSHKHLIIQNGFLYLKDIPAGPNKAIDVFLHSLAQEKLDGKAIAVFLSGAGMDGITGAEAIKKAGGVVIVQDPATCQHAAMPRHIIESGATDHILPPADIPAAILSYSHMHK